MAKGDMGRKKMAARSEIRRHQTVKLKLQGYTFRQIGQALGVDTSTACKLYHKAMDENRKTEKLEVEKIRELHSARLEEMIVQLKEKREVGDVQAILATKALLDRLGKLQGCDLDLSDGKDGSTVIIKVEPA